MTKVDIIANQAIEEDIIEILEKIGYGENFTCISPVFGRGRHGRKERSAVWPEENVMFMIEMEDAHSQELVDGLKELKTRFPNEGMRCYLHRGFERAL